MKFITDIIETYKKGLKFDKIQQKYEESVMARDELRRALTVCEKKQIEDADLKVRYKKALNEARKKIRALEGETELPSPNDLREYYMMKYKQSRWTYRVEYPGEKVDVKTMLRPRDEETISNIVDLVIEETSIQSRDGADKIMTKFFDWSVNEFDFDYKRDKTNFGKIEYWSRAEDTWKRGNGDCDDLAIFQHVVGVSLLEKLEPESSWRIRFTAGDTISEAHAYNVWLADDLEWYAFESTLNANDTLKKTWLTTPIKNNTKYTSFIGFATKHRSWRGSLSVVEPYELNKH